MKTRSVKEVDTVERAKRKNVRLEGYDYSSSGYYFITMCTKDRQNLLCKISEPLVGTVALDGPLVEMSDYGRIVERQLEGFRDFYANIKIAAYVIMPNHVHLLLYILPDFEVGPSRATVPTSRGGNFETLKKGPTVSVIGRFIGTIKRFCNREIGCDIWQARSHDEIIKNEAHLYTVEEYIAANPRRWLEDEHYRVD